MHARNRLFSALSLSLALSFSAVAGGCATSDTASVDDSYADAQSDATNPGSLSLWQSTDGQWRFNVTSGNGRVLLRSEGYASRTSALAGILSVLDNGIDPAQYQLHQTATGKWNLHLVAGNHETIATTETYASKSNATRAIDACVRALTSYLDEVESHHSGARVAFEEGAGSLFHFNVHAQNGEIILTSQRYRTKAAAWNGAFAAQDAAALSGYTIHTAEDGQFYFTLSAQNGEVVGVSETYTTRSSAQDAIDAVTSTLGALELL